MIYQLTSHLPESKKDIQERATPSHKDKEPQDIHPKSEAKDQETQKTQTSQRAQSKAFPEHDTILPASSDQIDHNPHPVQKKERKSSSQGTSNILILAEALVDTALSFVVQFFQLRGKK